VSIDAFKSGSTTASETDPDIAYDNWTGATSGQALDGSYRSSTSSSATVTVTFTGTSIDWITSKGPSFGKAAVRIDGVAMGTVDLYRSNQLWQSAITYAGLSDAPHTLVIAVLGQKSSASNGTKVPVDGFEVQG
jgi:hypothetical protein